MKQFRVMIVLLLLPAAGAETTFFDRDDAFIVSGSTADEVVEGITDRGIINARGCSYNWNCTNWSSCSPSGKQARNCLNVGTCSDWHKTPPVEQNCTYAATGQNKKNRWLGQEKALTDELELSALEQSGIRNTEIKNNLVKKEVIDWNKIRANFIISLIITGLIIIAVMALLKKRSGRIK